MSIIPHKCCSKCGIEKPLSDFHRSKSEADGYKPWCKVCRKQESKAYYWQDPDLQREKLRQRREAKPGYGKIALRQPYYCSCCDQVKTAADFSIDRHRKSGHSLFCAECRKSDRLKNQDKAKARNRKHYEQNRNQYIERARGWVRGNRDRRRAIVRIHSHKRRAWRRGSSGQYTQQEWITLCEYYDYHCLRCGRRAPEVQLTPDHIVPLSRGGMNTIDNIQPLCRICNTSKNARTIDYRPLWVKAKL